MAKMHERRSRGDVPQESDPVLTDEAKLLIEIRDLLAGRGGAVDPTSTSL
jgi:large conductance mechanosensitive channel